MSNKRLKRTEEEFFVYEPGVVVPRDVMHLLVPASVKILSAAVFRDLLHLREVVLSEGLREIGGSAFYGCKSLERVNFPSTLVRIGECAFFSCASLTTLHFLEGLTEIDKLAFQDCSSLQCISCSSTVTSIGDGAFGRCPLLEVVILVDGIRTIGHYAFGKSALENFVLPATLTKVGFQAFGLCRSLRMVKLSGGIQLIGAAAFEGCDLLNHIRITPKCLVVTKDGENYAFNFATDGTIVAHSDFVRVVISSECFHSMSPAQVSTLEAEIAEILGMQMHLEWENKHERLRGLLNIHEQRRKEEVAGLLKLGVRKAELRCLGAMGPGTGEESSLTSKVDVIVGNVVAFL